MQIIGGLNETPLHAALKQAVAPEGAAFEVSVDGYVVDVVHDDLLIEVQTRNLGGMRDKLARLLERHRVRLVLPVTEHAWIVKQPAGTRRRSPKRGHVMDVAAELVAIPHLLTHDNLEIDVLLIHQDEIREHREGVAWRRKGWVTIDRRLVAIVGRRSISGSTSLLDLLPAGLPERFGTAEVAKVAGASRRSAQQLLYCLRHVGLVQPVDKVGNAVQYSRIH